MSSVKMRPSFSCPNCGANIYSEVCEYCGSHIDFNTSQAELTYPLFNGTNVSNLDRQGFLFFFCILWESITLCVHIPFLFFGNKMFDGMFLLGIFFNVVFFGIFHLIGIGLLVLALKNKKMYKNVVTNGKLCNGICVGYTDHNRIKFNLEVDAGDWKTLFVVNQKDYRPISVGETVSFRVLEDKFVMLKEV